MSSASWVLREEARAAARLSGCKTEFIAVVEVDIHTIRDRLRLELWEAIQ
jgi:hypothetical protein